MDIRKPFITSRGFGGDVAHFPAMAKPPASIEAKEQGWRLEKLRYAYSMSQPELGDLVGVAANTISSYENGRTRIDILVLQRLCDRLKISADWIVNGMLHTLPHEIAARIQSAQRAALGAEPKRRGRPRRSAAPVLGAAEPLPLPPTPPTARSAPTPRAPRPTTHHRSSGLHEIQDPLDEIGKITRRE